MRKIYFPGPQWLSRIILLVLILGFSKRADAQGGTSKNDAIEVPACGGMDFTDYQDTGFGFSDNYGNSSPEVWYTFTLPVAGYVEISTCGSNFDTYLHVLDQYENEVLSDDDDSPCGGNTSLISDNLPAGTYYIVAEGYSDHTGDLEINITGSGSGSAAMGADMSGAVNAGTFGTGGGSYTDTRSNADACLGDDMGQPSNDIYYSFTLTATSKVTLSHCGSGFDTYMHLLNSGGVELTFNDDSYSSSCYSESYIETTLGPGTYYVVSEGYSDNTGYIVTTVTVAPVTPVTISYPSSSYTFMAGASVAPVVPAISNAPAFESQVATYAGSGSQGSADGSASNATFNWPLAAAMDGSGNLYVADSRNQRIRKISPSGTVSTLAGSGSSGYADGTGTGASFSNPAALAVDASGNVYVVDQQNNAIRKITPAGVVTTVAGNGTSGFANGTGTAARFSGPAGICIDGSGNLYIGDSGNNRIRKISPSGVVSTYAGSGSVGAANGAAASASFKDPRGLAMDASGNVIVCDRQNYLVRSISPSGTVSTLAGSGVQGWVDGPATSARFGGANSAAVDESGNLYVIDQGGNNMVRKIAADGTVSTLAGYPATGSTDGAGSVARFNTPYGICSGQDGILYVADTYNNKIRKIDTRPLNITPSLPAGLAFNYTNGSISGTPTTASPATVYTVTGYGASTALTIAVQGSCLALSQDGNYIVTYTPTEAGMATGASVTANSCDPYKVNTSVQYFDGLGRPLQTVQVKGNSDGTKDIVQPVEYDEFGREARKYLPYASATKNGSYKTDAFTAQEIFYNPLGSTGTQQANGVMRSVVPYSRTVFEASPLNRVAEQGAPGEAWQPAGTPNVTDAGHTVKIEYGSNSAGEVRLWTVTATGATGTADYNPNELYRTVSKDENWTPSDGKAGTAEEFKDKEGRVVLKRVWERDGKSLSTYYVYDDFGDLRYVLPPAVNENGQATLSNFTESDVNFNSFIYGYHYDGRNRLVEKKIPGKGWEYMIYNKLDQVVITQDANQRSHSGQDFTVIKYDALGRQVLSGYGPQSGTSAGTNYRTAAQTGADNQIVQWEARDNSTASGYTALTYGQAIQTYLTISYYDDYDIPGLPALYDKRTEHSTMTRGLLTASRTKVLNGTAGTSDMLWTVNYYDEKGRVVKTFSQHYAGGTVNEANYDEITNEWNFDSSLKSTARVHHLGTASTAIATAYTYDHMGRKLATAESINGALPATVVSAQTYNEIGQLKDKSVGDNLNTTIYTYNERGWLAGLTNSSVGFSETLKYNDAVTGTTAQYNGNIANQVYTNGSVGSTFNYEYDRLNRLTKGEVSPTVMSEVLTYDAMGNIASLNRDNTGANIYTYKNGNSSNQLQSVAGVTLGDYQYDANGNATTDGRNGRTIGYNVLNLPQTVSGGLSYTYDATGRKLKKDNNGTVRNYVDGIEYNGTAIDIIHTEEGIARNNGGTYSYEYNLADHLGNVRVSFTKNPNSQELDILQRDDYYAFGKRKDPVVKPGTNNYLYNGKELQEGIGQYDYGARFYDPVIGRWNVPDLLSEMHFDLTPYNYVMNNPINFIDPFGLDTLKTSNIVEGKHPELKQFNPDVDVIALNEVVVNSSGSSSSDNTQSAKGSEANSWGGSSRGGKIMAGTLLLGATTSEVLPAAVAILVGGSIVAGSVYIYDKIAGKGNANYPGPWSYTYEPPSRAPIHNPPNGFDPKEPPPGLGTAAKWLIGGRLLYEIYDEYQQRMNETGAKPIIRRDNTKVVQPQFIPYRPR